MLKRKTAALSSEIIQKQKENYEEESSKYTFVLRTRDVTFDNESLGKLLTTLAYRYPRISRVRLRKAQAH